MNFIEKIGSLIQKGFQFIIDAIFKLLQFIQKPFALLFELLKGIFYFIWKLFEIVLHVIQIFVALFQFIFSIFAGIFRTIRSWLTVSPSAGDVSFPSVSSQGFKVVTDLLQPTGLMTIVPIVATAFLWLYFVIKIIGLFGGQIMIRPFGHGGGDS